MSEYFMYFSHYFNVILLIWDGIKTGLLCCFISLILLIILKKLVLVKRRYKFLRCLACSYFLLIPLTCLFFGSIYGAVISARDQMVEKLPLYQASIQSIVDSNFDITVELVDDSNQNFTKSLDDIVYDIQTIMVSKLQFTPQDGLAINQLMLDAIASPAAFNYIKSNLKDKISNMSGLDRKLVDEVFTVKLSQLFISDVILKIIVFYVNQIMMIILMPIIVIWGLLIFVAITETAIAYFVNRRRVHIENFVKTI